MVSVLTFSDAAPQSNTACLTQLLARDEAAFVLLLFPVPVSRHQLKLIAVLIEQKRGMLSNHSDTDPFINT